MINLDSIRREVAGEKVPDKVLQVLKYQAIKNERVSKYPKSEQNKFLGSAFGTDRHDFFLFEKLVTMNHFLKKDLIFCKYTFLTLFSDLSVNSLFNVSSVILIKLLLFSRSFI